MDRLLQTVRADLHREYLRVLSTRPDQLEAFFETVRRAVSQMSRTVKENTPLPKIGDVFLSQQLMDFFKDRGGEEFLNQLAPQPLILLNILCELAEAYPEGIPSETLQVEFAKRIYRRDATRHSSAAPFRQLLSSVKRDFLAGTTVRLESVGSGKRSKYRLVACPFFEQYPHLRAALPKSH